GNKRFSEASHILRAGNELNQKQELPATDGLLGARAFSKKDKGQFMKSKLLIRGLSSFICLAMTQISLTAIAASGATGYVEINLVSDSTNAAHVDARLLNPWGIVASPQTLWVNDNHSGLMTVYSASGRPNPYAV